VVYVLCPSDSNMFIAISMLASVSKILMSLNKALEVSAEKALSDKNFSQVRRCVVNVVATV
jgi:uncharacterized membrane protein